MKRVEPYKLLAHASIVATLPVAMQFLSLRSVFAEYEAGYTAFGDRRGPGNGRIRAAGWLQAPLDDLPVLPPRQEARRSQF